MAYFSEELKKILSTKKEELDDINTKLTYEEVLCDKKLTVMLKTKQKTLDIILEKYNIVNNLINEINTLSAEEKQVFCLEITKTEKQIYKLKNEIMHLLFDQNGQNESVIVELYCSNITNNYYSLLDAYKNFCENNNYNFNKISENKIEICGKNASKYFLTENGVHKLNGTKVEVLCYPAPQREIATFDENDIKIDVFRSNGAGGQNVNKVSTAIRATHLKTNITVVCQDERSQIQNKVRALEVLKERVNNFYNTSYENELSELRKKYYSSNLVRIYDYNKNIVTQNNKTISLTDFFNGNYLELFY